MAIVDTLTGGARQLMPIMVKLRHLPDKSRILKTNCNSKYLVDYC